MLNFHILSGVEPRIVDCICKVYDLAELLEVKVPDGENRPETVPALYILLDQLLTAIDEKMQQRGLVLNE